jgi:arylsulfatase A-like enzyme
MKAKVPLGLFSCIALVSCTSGSRLDGPPNIVYILADDLGYGDLSCYGQKKFSTPNIDRLAAEGMLFNQHYTGCTVSAPSRSSLMTGLHTGHTPIRGNKEWNTEGQWPLPDSSLTVAEILRSKGFATGAYGKWGLGFIGTEGDPDNQGFDEFFGYNCQRLAHNYYPYYLWHNSEKIMLPDNAGTGEGTYAPDIIHKKALEFIDNNRDKPFFLYYPTVIPHAELFAKEKYLEMFRGKFLPEKEFIGMDSGPNFRLGPYGSQPESHAAFAAMVTQLDDYVGEISALLKKLGLEKNTIVMFSSDNGPHLEGGADPDYFDSNGPLKGYKRDLYEGGIRTPLIVKWSGRIKASSKSDHVSAFWDVLPTLAEIAGADPVKGIDGISFLPELLGNEQKQHEYLYWEFHEQGGKAAVRMGYWKAVKRDIEKIPHGKTELYDLRNDIGETTDIASQNKEIVHVLDSLIELAHVKSDDFPFVCEAADKKHDK